MKVESVNGWNLLAGNKQAQAIAQKYFMKSLQNCAYESRPSMTFGWLDSKIVDGELLGNLTAFFVILHDGRTVQGIAPSLLSAQRRARRLIQYGYCFSAGFPKPQRLN
jgi:hypothetical protein